VSESNLFKLSDIAASAQADIQKNFKDIDPIVGLIRNLRASGFPADAMTIDCLKSGKRITLVLHDNKPNEVAYQFGFRDKDPADEFTYLPFDKVTSDQLYNWMKDYFSEATNQA